MRNTARYASFIAFASVACVASAQGLSQRPMDFMAPTASIERAVTVIHEQALDGYFGQLAGDLAFRIAVFHQPVDRDMPEQPSGIEAPGTIFVSDQVLAEAKDEATFARTIAHAMAHVSLMHRNISSRPDLKLATRQPVSPIIFMTGNGWKGYAQREPSLVHTRMLPLGYAKQNEAEADQASAEILAGLHLDAAGFARAQAAVR